MEKIYFRQDDDAGAEVRCKACRKATNATEVHLHTCGCVINAERARKARPHLNFHSSEMPPGRRLDWPKCEHGHKYPQEALYLIWGSEGANIQLNQLEDSEIALDEVTHLYIYSDLNQKVMSQWDYFAPKLRQLKHLAITNIPIPMDQHPNLEAFLRTFSALQSFSCSNHNFDSA
jgi:hypothetical protein